MTTEEIIIHIFCYVDDRMKTVSKVLQSKLYPGEVVTIGIVFALKGGHFRAFYRWLSRDYGLLFGGLPDRTALQRQLRQQQCQADELLSEASLLNVVDSFPIELLFPIREGRSKQQIGKKSRDKGTVAHLQARLAYTAAMFNVLISLDRHFHPDHPAKLSIADFSL